MGYWELESGYRRQGTGQKGQAPEPRFSVVAYDFGVKFNILRHLVEAGCRVRVVPAHTPAAEVLRLKPDGVFLSNGPGDPDALPYARENIAALVGQVPPVRYLSGTPDSGSGLGWTDL